MRRRRNISIRQGERGVVILLVAIILLFVVGAMAVLAVDQVTNYTARSEAQLAADGGALAGARVLANSGITSLAVDAASVSDAENLARTAATQVAMSNKIGGGSPTAVTVNFQGSFSTSGLGSNPRITVQVTRDDLPTFFARIWGTTQTTVSASATAEAYNPSGHNVSAGLAPPVAPTCVKPWVLPNISPVDNTSQMFDPASGAIQGAPALLGWTDVSVPARFFARCSGNACNNWASLNPQPWQYYPGAPSSFSAPTQSLPTCAEALNSYQKSIAGCVTTPIACNSQVQLDQSNYAQRNARTSTAANCLTHAGNQQGDRVIAFPPESFQFQAGDDNPVPDAVSKNVMVSDSLVTVPVYNSSNGVAPGSTVQVIGFVQLFLSPDGRSAQFGPGRVTTTIVNLVGCGTNATGQPVFGNGASPVAVRLISQ